MYTYRTCSLLWTIDEEFDDVDDKASYKNMLKRDERRFKAADRDGDLIATRQEFTAFLHPEDYDHMRDIIVQVRPGVFFPPTECLGIPLHILYGETEEIT